MIINLKRHSESIKKILTSKGVAKAKQGQDINEPESYFSSIKKTENQNSSSKETSLPMSSDKNSSFIEDIAKPRTYFRAKTLYIISGVLVGAVVIGVLLFFFSHPEQSGFLTPIVNIGNSISSNKVTHPITGEVFDKSAAESWVGTRPLGVMINNHIDARPQVGLIDADIVYEVVAEGGITRFLTFFNSKIPEKVGPIRSTREYYLVLVKELGDAMIMHIGWSPQALEAIETWPVRSLSRGGAPFYRENPRNVATEHTAYADGSELIKRAVELGWDGVGEFEAWKFKDNSNKYQSYDNASKLTIDFWHPGDYSAIWEYNMENNVYLRSMGYSADDSPLAHLDDATKEQIAVKNLIVQFAKETNIIGDDKGRLEYELIGTNDGFVFTDGKVIPVTWSKDERDARTKYYDGEGEEIEFNRGKFWVSIVPARNVDQVVYE